MIECKKILHKYKIVILKNYLKEIYKNLKKNQKNMSINLISRYLKLNNQFYR